MQKLKETEKTSTNQTWPKWSDTTLHSTLKLVRRIGSSEKWVRSNLVTSKPRSLATSLSLLYKCQSQTSSCFKVGLEVELCLSVSSIAYKMPTSTVATLSSSFFTATSVWRQRKTDYGSLGLSTNPYSKLKVEWMKDLVSNNLNDKSSTLLLDSAWLASIMVLSSYLVWSETINLWVRSTSSLSKLATRDLS